MGGSCNILNMEQDREYWLNCLAEFELALQAEMNMIDVAPAWFNDSMIRLLNFEIEQCINQLA